MWWILNIYMLPRPGEEVPKYKSTFAQPSPQQQRVPPPVRISFMRRSDSNENRAGNGIGMGIPNFILHNPIISTKCQLCEEPHQRNQLESVGGCEHVFCIQCLNTYCIYRIDTMSEVTCPKEGCPAVLDPRGTVFYRLPEKSKERYTRNTNWKQTINNPNLKLCPTEHCQGIINVSRGDFSCPKCHVSFCKECELPKHEGRCDKNFQENFRQWKRCPKCHVFIERTEGCNHMVCRCTHEFCYVCLSDWNEQHYNCETNPLLRTERWVWDLPRAMQVIVGILMVPIFPLYLVFLLIVWVLGIAIATVIGFLCRPVMMAGTYASCNAGLICIMCPILMVVGALAGFFMTLCLGIVMVCKKCWDYWSLVCRILFDPSAPSEEGPDELFDNEQVRS